MKPYQLTDLIAISKGFKEFTDYQYQGPKDERNYTCYRNKIADSSSLKQTRGKYLLRAENLVIEANKQYILKLAKTLVDQDLVRMREMLDEYKKENSDDN